MKKNSGFTLIEVLVALAILSIALTAIIKSTSQNIKDTLYIKNKTIASWVGTQIMNEARIDLLKLPLAPDTQDEETTMLGQVWLWKANIKPTPNPHIQEIDVDVFDKASNTKLITLVSYKYV